MIGGLQDSYLLLSSPFASQHVKRDIVQHNVDDTFVWVAKTVPHIKGQQQNTDVSVIDL